MDTSLRAILINKDPEAAKDYVKSQISQLLMNEMDMSKLVVSKALTRTSDQYAAGNKQARTARGPPVCNRRRHEPNSAPPETIRPSSRPS